MLSRPKNSLKKKKKKTKKIHHGGTKTFKTQKITQ
jgi:hypothetical protein